MIKIGLYFLLNVIICNVYATEQTKDILIWNNDTLFLYDSPLETIPNITSRIEQLRKGTVLENSTDCWRGYYAEWKMINDELCLSNVYECNSNRNLNKTIESILKKSFQNGLIKANWVCGDFWCGINLETTRFSYKDEYKLSFINGLKCGVIESHYKPCENLDKDKLSEFVISHLDWKSLPWIKGTSFHLKALLTPKTNGEVLKVIIIDSPEQIYNEEFIRVLKEIPCIPVYYYKGEFQENGEEISIYVDKLETENKKLE